MKWNRSELELQNRETVSNKYDFKTLTPNDEIDIEVYEEAINFVFDDEDLRNIAIAGQYGSGKSSVLESYKNKNKSRKFLHVSVAHFNNILTEENTSENNNDEGYASVLEWKILNQLIHQIEPESIKFSKFKTKKNHEFWSKDLLLPTGLLGLLMLTSFYVIGFSRLKDYSNTIDNVRYVSSIIVFLTSEIVWIIAVFFLGGIILFFIYYLLYLQKNNMLFKRIKVKDNEIEMFEEDNDSYFDHYLNEVLYLFENIEEETIVFEDIDRFNDSGIFERLHEINRLVNYHQKDDKTIRFFYLIKDDVFTSRDRTKFFDFIIPIVPISDSSNAHDILLRYFKNNKENYEIEDRFIQDISLYLDDMRIIKNVFNEFLIYSARLKGNNLSKTKLLAMVIYKNLFPKDFSDLQLNTGLVYALFEQKYSLVENQINQLEKDITTLEEDIELIKNEVANSKEELEAIFLKLYSKQSYYSSPEIKSDKIEEYDRRKSLIERVEDVESLNLKILKKKEKISELTIYPLRIVLSKTNIDKYFNEIEYTNALTEIDYFRDVKVNKYFDLLKYLIRNGYIDESYFDYMSYFYAESITREDKDFLRSIANQQKLDPNYKLNNPEKVIENMDKLTIRQEEAQNFDLLEYMLQNDNIPKHQDLLVSLLSEIKESLNYEFIYEFFKKKKLSRTKLTKHLIEEWNDFWNDVYLNSRLDAEFVKQFSLEILINGSNLSDINYNIDGNLTKYISNNEEYLDIADLKIGKEVEIISSLKKHEISFVKMVNANKSLLEKIYLNNLYELTQYNISLIIKDFYRNTSETSMLRNYSIIMSENDSNLAKYVTSNKEKYLSYLLEETNVKFSDEIKWYLDIVNDENITTEIREKYLKSSEVKIASLIEVQEIDFWNYIISSNQVVFSEINLYNYYLNVADSELFASFVNINAFDLKMYEMLESEEKYFDFFKFVVGNNYINNDKYNQVVESFSRSFKGFNIKSINEEKINVLIDLNAIEMNDVNLVFVRENYSNNLLYFIIENFDEYIIVLNENKNKVIQDELEEILELDLNDIRVEEVLSLSSKSISIKGKGYKNNVISLILNRNYDEDELPYLIEEYERFNIEIKSKINNIVIENIDALKTNLNIASKYLVLDILNSVYTEMKYEDKVQMFIETIQLFNQEEITDLFETLNLEEYVDFFDFKKRRNVVFEINELNRSILESLKSADLITDYNPIKDKNYYSVKRKKKNKI